MKTCDPGEACLYYSWRKSATETSVIRECFPTSVLLGSIDKPVEPGTQCSPSSIESDSISACICTTDLCNGIGNDDINQEVSGVSITTVRPATTTSLAPRRSTTEKPQPTSIRGRVKCHQCGSLFAGSSSNPECDVFMEDDPLQESYCAAGEVCLWYSWQKSRESRSFIRQCFSPSIVLGSPDTPLVPRSKCTPQYVSDSNQISACLCNTDLCNSYRSADEVKPDVLPVRTVPQARPIPVSGGSQQEQPRRRKFSSPQQSSNTIGKIFKSLVESRVFFFKYQKMPYLMCLHLTLAVVRQEGHLNPSKHSTLTCLVSSATVVAVSSTQTRNVMSSVELKRHRLAYFQFNKCSNQ